MVKVRHNMTIVEIFQGIATLAAFILALVAILKGKAERTNLDATAAAAYAKAATDIANMYESQFKDLKERLIRQDNERIIYVKRFQDYETEHAAYVKQLQTQKDEQIAYVARFAEYETGRITLIATVSKLETHANAQDVEMAEVKLENRRLRLWISELCEQIKAAGKEPVPCPD